MKREIFTALLIGLLVALVSLAHSQESALPPNIPADKVAAASKPFLGTFDGVSCQEPLVGLRYRVEQEGTAFPTFTLLAVANTNEATAVGEKWITLIFTTKVDPVAGTHDFVYTSNDKILMTLAAMPNGKLVGMAVTDEDKMLVLFKPMDPAQDLTTAAREMKHLCTDKEARRKFAGFPEPKVTTPETAPGAKQ